MDVDAEAQKALVQCLTPMGITASTNEPDGRYPQCWTRDLCLIVLASLSFNPIPGNVFCALPVDLVTRHLIELAQRQTPEGQIPILFVPELADFIRRKEEQERKTGRTPFMLRRFREEGEHGIAQLTPHTRDSEILFILAALLICQLQPASSNVLLPAIELAIQYVRRLRLASPLRLITGGDWRDNTPQLNDKCVLSNACLLYHAANLVEAHRFLIHSLPSEVSSLLIEEEGETLPDLALRINGLFWRCGVCYFTDISNGPLRFDLLGNALAILCKLASPSQIEGIYRYLLKEQDLIIPTCGFVVTQNSIPPFFQGDVAAETEALTQQLGGAWPYSSGFMLLALSQKTSGKINDTIHWTRQWTSHWAATGFHEWYDMNALPRGSRCQMWSAAMTRILCHHLFLNYISPF